MATTIVCDGGGETHPADVLINRIDGSEATAWCDQHYLDLMIVTVETVMEAQAAQAAIEAEQKLAAANANRPDPLTERVVRKGTSRSRREHDERQAERAARLGGDDEPGDEPGDETPLGEVIEDGREVEAP